MRGRLFSFISSALISCKMWPLWLILAIILLIKFGYNFNPFKNWRDTIPLSVNYFFSRKCNYKCGFCFHTDKNSFQLPIEQAKLGLKLLKEAGMQKITFAGGEPFLNPKFLGELVKYCKLELKLSTSIISNGSLIKHSWIKSYGKYLDIMGVSCDSFSENFNLAIGRCANNVAQQVDILFKVREWCAQEGILFKLNTVVTAYNWEENMSDQIVKLNLYRWKIFQVNTYVGENGSEADLRDARPFVVSDGQFQDFTARHRHLKCCVPETEEIMKNSYYLVDERMRFIDKVANHYGPSLLDVGVVEAMKASQFDEEQFLSRGGVYQWSKDPNSPLPEW